MSRRKSEWPGKTPLRQYWNCIGAFVCDAPFQPDTRLDVSSSLAPDAGILITVAKDGTVRWLFQVTADDLRAQLKWLRPSIEAPVKVGTERRTRTSAFEELVDAVGKLLESGTVRRDLRCTMCSSTVRGVTTITIYHPDGVITAYLSAREMYNDMTDRQKAARRYLDGLDYERP